MLDRKLEPKLVALLGRRSQKQEEEEEKQEKTTTAVKIDIASKTKGEAKLVLQVCEWIGYSLLGMTGFFWLFWFNSPFFDYVEIPVIAGIVLVAASLIYDNKTTKKTKAQPVPSA